MTPTCERCGATGNVEHSEVLGVTLCYRHFKDRDAEMRIAGLLADVAHHVRRYIVLSDHQTAAVALWVAHTHAFDAASITPYLNIHSAEKESGKTLLLEVLRPLVPKAWLTGGVSKAVLVRKVGSLTPTLLLDESDVALNADKEYAEALRGVLNNGYIPGVPYSVCVGKDHDWKDFDVFCPKAIAGLGRLPDTVESRSIPVRMKRRAPGEQVERHRRRDVSPVAEAIFDKLTVWADDEPMIERLAAARPDLPDELGDRAADVWEPLFGIADLAGGKWSERAREAAKALSRAAEPDEATIRVRLLVALRAAFEKDGTDRLTTQGFRDHLHAQKDEPWSDWSRGNPISARKVADLLRPFEIKPHKIRIGEETVRGYEWRDCEDAFERYIPAPPGSKWNIRNNGANKPETGGLQSGTQPQMFHFEKGQKPHEQANVPDVPDRTGGNGQIDPSSIVATDETGADEAEVVEGEIVADQGTPLRKWIDLGGRMR